MNCKIKLESHSQLGPQQENVDNGEQTDKPVATVSPQSIVDIAAQCKSRDTSVLSYSQPEYTMSNGCNSLNQLRQSSSKFSSDANSLNLKIEPSRNGIDKANTNYYARDSPHGQPAVNRSTNSQYSPLHNAGPSELSFMSSSHDKKKNAVDDKAAGRRCQICNDGASGFHYGVWSCEGCKAFFKRSLQGPVDYVCPSTNTCTIDKQRRKSCQACRLRKCIETGMSRGNCRKERKGGLQKGQKRKSFCSSEHESCGPSDSKCSDPTTNTKEVNRLLSEPESNYSGDDDIAVTESSKVELIAPLSTQHIYSTKTNQSTAAALPLNSQQKPEMNDSRQPEHISKRQNSETEAPSISANSDMKSFSALPSIHPLAEHLIRLDPPSRTSGHDYSISDTEENLTISLMRLADNELVDVINWAKSIPGYANLELKERVHLLEVCWMEVLLAGVLWHSSQSAEGELLHFARDLSFDRNRMQRANLSHLGGGLVACAKKFHQLNINQEEFVLFRSLLLLNSDICYTSLASKVTKLHSTILDALQYTVMERHGGSMSKMLSLLTMLPHIRQLSIQWIAHLMHCPNSHHLNRFALLKEMVDGHINSVDYNYLVLPAQANSQENDSPGDSKDQFLQQNIAQISPLSKR